MNSVPERMIAKEQGLVRYFTGKPCKNNHIAERFVSDGKCLECNRLKMRAYWEKYPDAVKKRNDYLRTRKDRNPDAYKIDLEQKKHKWHNDEVFRNATKELSKKNHLLRYENLKYVEKIKIQSLEWAKNNRGKHRAKTARRRAALLNATPKWVDQQEITKIYLSCPKGYHVDHIVPLKGENVSGLHVPWNLQHLPAKQNLSKGNKFTVIS